LRELIRWYCHHSPFDKGKFRLAMWAFQHLPPHAPLRTRLANGTLIELLPADLIQSEIYYIGYYEFYLARFFRAQVQPGWVFADVGAHIGQYTLIAAERGAYVHAFEPNPQNLARLQRNLELNHLTQVVFNSVAVSDRPGESVFQLPEPANTGSGSLRSQDSGSKNAITVKTITLDDYFASQPAAPHIIKLDVEGAELLALRGAVRLLRVRQPLLMLEVAKENLRAFGHTPEQLLDFLRQCNYRLYVLERARLKPLATDQPIEYGNLICFPTMKDERFTD
jgi:FkbM family methyltransferase